MSSDSDDDCYGNIAKKLQSIKSNYKEDKIKTSSILEDSAVSVNNSVVEDLPIIQRLKEEHGLDDEKDESVESILKRHGGKLVKPAKTSEPDGLYIPDIPVPRVKRKSSRRIAAIQKRAKAASTRELVASSQPETSSTLARPNNLRRTPSTSLQSSTSQQPMSAQQSTSAQTSTTANVIPSPARGRGRSRGRGRGQKRGRGRGRWSNGLPYNLNYNEIINDIIYSIGNTEDYDDMSRQQDLFSKKPEPVVIIDDDLNDSLDDNEEMSVKVYWQSLEFFKFTIRRFQKFTEIYNFFANKENVKKEKLLFTYNDKIVNIDDCPDTINYNIGKFIDGGIVNQSLSPLKKNVKQEVKSGLKLKFQCQNSKKPFETAVEADEKLSLSMRQCAEHFEKPLEKLKFYFDGDLISGKSTPKDLELEGGECIDVVIIS